MHIVVAHVGANPLVVRDDLQLLGENHEVRDLLRMLREQANRTLNLLRHLVALDDRTELRVVHHHCGEERGQFLEGVVDRVNQGQLHERGESVRINPLRAHSLRRHVVHQEEPQEAQREAVFHLHSPQARELDVLERLGEVDDGRSCRKNTEAANSPVTKSSQTVCRRVRAVCPNQQGLAKPRSQLDVTALRVHRRYEAHL